MIVGRLIDFGVFRCTQSCQRGGEQTITMGWEYKNPVAPEPRS